MDMDIGRGALNFEQAAQHLGVSLEYVETLITDRKVFPIVLEGEQRLTRSELDRFLDELSRKAQWTAQYKAPPSNTQQQPGALRTVFRDKWTGEAMVEKEKPPTANVGT